MIRKKLVEMSTKETESPDNQSSITPRCIGIIMDGNRRWAKERGLPTLKGHYEGYKRFKEVVGWCKEEGIRDLVVYAFSTENWNRKEEEVTYLMDLMRTLFNEWLPKLHKENVAIRVVGDLSRFPSDLQESINTLHKENPENAERHLWVAASYGGRPEILAAINTLLEKGEREVTEEMLSKELWTSGMPDPDIILRTGGQRRLSNFLLWQAAYSELWFTDTAWPDFSKEEFMSALNEFARCKRNFGK